MRTVKEDKSVSGVVILAWGVGPAVESWLEVWRGRGSGRYGQSRRNVIKSAYDYEITKRREVYNREAAGSWI